LDVLKEDPRDEMGSRPSEKMLRIDACVLRFGGDDDDLLRVSDVGAETMMKELARRIRQQTVGACNWDDPRQDESLLLWH
jgi:hypothetical protein